jgi:hypothetical protein
MSARPFPISPTPLFLAGLALVAGACGSSSARRFDGGDAGSGHDSAADSISTPASDAGVHVDAVSEAEASAGADAAAPVPRAFVRLAHLSPDLPAVDLCVAPHGTSDYQGPLLGRLANRDGGGGGGVSYPQVSAYLSVNAGQNDVRLVPAGAISCAPDGADASVSPIIPESTDLPPLPANARVTLLVIGELSPAGSDAPLKLAVVADDVVLAGGSAVLRAVNAVPSLPAVDFGFGSFAGGWQPLLTHVAFGAASAAAAPSDGTVDANGYLFILPLASQTVSARASSGATVDVAVASRFDIGLGSIATFVVIGGKTGDSGNPPALLLCIDNQPTGSLLSDCSVAR